MREVTLRNRAVLALGTRGDGHEDDFAIVAKTELVLTVADNRTIGGTSAVTVASRGSLRRLSCWSGGSWAWRSSHRDESADG